MRKWVPLLLLMGLAACKKPEIASADEASKVDLYKPTAGSAKAVESAPRVSVPLLAYAYDYKLDLPGERIQQAMDHDQQACATAGPETCQLVGASLNREGDSVGGAHLELRAVPTWIASFRAGIEGQTKAVGGHVQSSDVASEDLSRSIVDTEAAIRAQTTLRDRIQKVLADRPGKLSDVMDAEHELAKVQGDLDATQSELAVMRTRVATSKLTIDYQAEGATGPNGVLRPLREAAGGAVSNMTSTLAFLVTLCSFLLPIGFVGAIIFGLVMMVTARRRAAEKSRRAATAA